MQMRVKLAYKSTPFSPRLVVLVMKVREISHLRQKWAAGRSPYAEFRRELNSLGEIKRIGVK